MTKKTDSKLLESLKKKYDAYLKGEELSSDVEVFDEILKDAIAKQSHGGTKVLTEIEVNTFNQFIAYHNGKVDNSNDPQFYSYKLAQDANKNLFLLDGYNSTAQKLEYHGSDTDFLQSVKNLFIPGNDNLDKLKKEAVNALADGIIDKKDIDTFKKLSRESGKYDISVFKDMVVIHEDGKADDTWGNGKVPESAVEMLVSNVSANIPMKDIGYYLDLERKAEKSRAENNPQKTHKGNGRQ